MLRSDNHRATRLCGGSSSKNSTLASPSHLMLITICLQAKCDGKTLDSTGNGDRVQTINMSGSMRVSCDVCATSIPNLYR